jgi:hypothetical protein
LDKHWSLQATYDLSWDWSSELILSFCSARDWTQGLAHARNWTISPAPHHFPLHFVHI